MKTLPREHWSLQLCLQTRSPRSSPIEVGVDNSGAYNLVQRKTVARHSKHIERRCYKMRELYHQGLIRVNLIPTAEMHADMLTKALDDKTFHKHRKRCMNL